MSMEIKKFEDLKLGQVFMFDGKEDIYLRVPYFVDNCRKNENNIYNLSENYYDFAIPTDRVIPLKTELIIH